MKRTATNYSLRTKVNMTSSVNWRKRNEMSPSESVIRNILNYSKALAVFKTPDNGILHLVMN